MSESANNNCQNILTSCPLLPGVVTFPLHKANLCLGSDVFISGYSKQEETGGPRGNPHRHGENMPTPHRKDPGRPAGESNPEPSRRQGYSLKSWRLYKLRPAPSMYTPSRQTRSACVRAYRLCVA
ncbi:hypothetical protein AOLI_G00040630 [Acnodon oligacanthus]